MLQNRTSQKDENIQAAHSLPNSAPQSTHSAIQGPRSTKAENALPQPQSLQPLYNSPPLHTSNIKREPGSSTFNPQNIPLASTPSIEHTYPRPAPPNSTLNSQVSNPYYPPSVYQTNYQHSHQNNIRKRRRTSLQNENCQPEPVHPPNINYPPQYHCMPHHPPHYPPYGTQAQYSSGYTQSAPFFPQVYNSQNFYQPIEVDELDKVNETDKMDDDPPYEPEKPASSTRKRHLKQFQTQLQLSIDTATTRNAYSPPKPKPIQLQNSQIIDIYYKLCNGQFLYGIIRSPENPQKAILLRASDYKDIKDDVLAFRKGDINLKAAKGSIINTVAEWQGMTKTGKKRKVCYIEGVLERDDSSCEIFLISKSDASNAWGKKALDLISERLGEQMHEREDYESEDYR